MNDATLIAAYGALLLAGLAGSLHCIGMCGPLLVGFSQLFAKAEREEGAGAPRSSAAQAVRIVNGSSKTRPALRLTVAPAADSMALAQRSVPSPKGRGVGRDLALYHCGRVWTYGMLGFVAGLLGDAARHGATWLGWQRPVMVSISMLVIATGVLMLGIIPRARLDRVVAGCGIKQINARPWLKGLAKHGSLTSRLLLGAVMGLLPCGLVYAALVMAAAMPSPAHAALGMVAFGVGTLPSLSAAFLAIKMVPLRWRAHGTKFAACVVIATGGWMTWRAATIDPSCGCHVARVDAPIAAAPAIAAPLARKGASDGE